MTVNVILKRFDTPDETRFMEKGRFEIVHLGSMTIGRASYEPGWKWWINVRVRGEMGLGEGETFSVLGERGGDSSRRL